MTSQNVNPRTKKMKLLRNGLYGDASDVVGQRIEFDTPKKKYIKFTTHRNGHSQEKKNHNKRTHTPNT